MKRNPKAYTPFTRLCTHQEYQLQADMLTVTVWLEALVTDVHTGVFIFT